MLAKARRCDSILADFAANATCSVSITRGA